MAARSHRFAALLAALLLTVIAVPICAADVVKGLVVDRNDRYLWITLPEPVPVDTLFNVYLIPGGRMISTSRVVECTPDSPVVAKASYRLVGSGESVPVGAYAESADAASTDITLRPEPRPASIGRGDGDRLRFQTGALLLADSQLSDETGDMWPVFQVTYRLGSHAGHDLLLGAGYLRQDGTFAATNGEGAAVTGTRKVVVLPITLDARIGFGSARSDRGPWYTRLGIGAYITRDERSTGGVSDFDRDNARFGWRAGVGYESRGGGFAELYYMDVSETDLQGAAFSLGARF